MKRLVWLRAPYLPALTPSPALDFDSQLTPALPLYDLPSTPLSTPLHPPPLPPALQSSQPSPRGEAQAAPHCGLRAGVRVAELCPVALSNRPSMRNTGDVKPFLRIPFPCSRENDHRSTRSNPSCPSKQNNHLK